MCRERRTRDRRLVRRGRQGNELCLMLQPGEGGKQCGETNAETQDPRAPRPNPGDQKPGFLIAWIRAWGAWVLRFGIGFAALFATFAWLKHKAKLISLSATANQAPISRAALAAHLIAVAVFGSLSALLY